MNLARAKLAILVLAPFGRTGARALTHLYDLKRNGVVGGLMTGWRSQAAR
jgi:hypothetical protein